MCDYLVFRLYGPMASWGEIAVGETRHSAVYPSKSALIGLLAAALGVRREDETQQTALAIGYRFGVKLVSVGMPLRDYHTIQVPDVPKKVRYRTRRQEVANRSRLGTLLSAREYRCDSLAIVAVEALPESPHTLPGLQRALEQPHFPLYLGRKSCPLAVPLQAKCEAFVDLKSALDAFDSIPLPGLNRAYENLRALNANDNAARYYWDDGMDAGMADTMVLTRNDQPTSRQRWQFAPRREHVRLCKEGT